MPDFLPLKTKPSYLRIFRGVLGQVFENRFWGNEKLPFEVLVNVGSHAFHFVTLPLTEINWAFVICGFDWVVVEIHYALAGSLAFFVDVPFVHTSVIESLGDY